jgi:crotonobetainyl-CoA:carnitine CoA-transferase CaiB-like acyl-CoA transferase
MDAEQVPCEFCDPDFGRRLHDDNSMIERGWVASYDHPSVGRLSHAGLLFDLSDTPARVQRPPLLVGQHTREILLETGYSKQQVDLLEREGVVLQWQGQQTGSSQ